MTVFRLVVRDGKAQLQQQDGTLVAEHPFALDPAISDRIERLTAALGGVDGAILAALAVDRARLLLDLESPLEDEPWESLRASGGLWLAGRHRLACVVSGARPPQDFEPCWPLRILICVGCLDNDRLVEPLAEVRALERTYDDGRRRPTQQQRIRADIQLLWSVREPLRTLIDRIRELRPHILHFIGHGIDAVDGGRMVPALRVEVPGAPEDWTPRRLDDAFSALPDSRVSRLVVLNACGTAKRVGPRSLAETFVNWGAVAVVSMAGPIGGADAGRFSGALARGIVGGQELGEAVRCAREGMASEWQGIPRLYLRDGVDQVLPQLPEEPVTRRTVLRDSRLAGTSLFACRHEFRWRLWARVHQDGATVVIGPGRVGKTSLACLITERALLAGTHARYVDLNEFNKPHSWLTVLQDLRAVRPPWSHAGRINADWPAGAFQAFTERLRELTDPARFRMNAAADLSGSWSGPRPTGLHPDAGSRGEQDVVAAFRAGLLEQARRGRLLLVIDHVPDTLDVRMFEDLLAPLLLSPPEGTHVVMVLLERQRDLLLVPDDATIRISGYDNPMIADLVADRAISEGGVVEAKVRTLAEQARQSVTFPGVFASFLEAIALRT